MKTKLPTARGFTLIELMIVVAVVGVLAAIALPAYNDYTIRTKVSSMIVATSKCRLAISEVVQTSTTLPAPSTPDPWNCENPLANETKYIQQLITNTNGAIFVYPSAEVAGDLLIGNGEFLLLMPCSDLVTDELIAKCGYIEAGRPIVEWKCGSAKLGLPQAIPDKHLPTTCRNRTR